MRRLAIAAALAVLLGGCADPYRHVPRGVTPRPTPQARPIAPTATARAFALRWVNWDWRSAAAQQGALAQLAAGQLAIDLRANAASARIDASLQRDKPRVRGSIAAVDLTTGAGVAQGLVVTREQSYTAGRSDLGGPHYRVYTARLMRHGSVWEVSAWQPQP